MAATVLARRFTGAGAGSGVDVTSGTTYHVAEDAHYASSPSNPVPVPAVDQNYSYWVSLRLQATVTPDTLIDNIRFFMNEPWAGPAEITWLGQTANVGANAGYRQADGTVAVSGDVLDTTNHTGLTAAPVDPFTWDSASPLTLVGSLSNPSTGDFGDFLVTQAVVGAGATGTEQPTPGWTFIWDES